MSAETYDALKPMIDNGPGIGQNLCLLSSVGPLSVAAWNMGRCVLWCPSRRFVNGGRNNVFSQVSQHVAGSYSADAIILVVRLDEPTDRVWGDISNPGGSSNHHIALTAFDGDGEELGLRMGSIGRELTRVEYTHPTPDITIFSIDIGGGFWSYPIDAVGAGVIPEPSTLLLYLGAFALLSFRRRAPR